MRFSTSLVFFATVVTGTFLTVTVSAAPYTGSSNPAVSDSPSSLERRRSEFPRSDRDVSGKAKPGFEFVWPYYNAELGKSGEAKAPVPDSPSLPNTEPSIDNIVKEVEGPHSLGPK
ncbi:hypothetical protein BC835DRAFT_1374602 [Cytidiella melzeri]|nr:hypothetical protein BC835DRAFT_1374602 [Cytidiella melzeri]